MDPVGFPKRISKQEVPNDTLLPNEVNSKAFQLTGMV